MFDVVAPFYSCLTANKLWRASIREMARHLPPSGAALRLLDVGCGPGNSTIELLRLRPDLRITGLDRSIGMLHQARRFVQYESQTNLRITQADAAHLPFAESSMDAITAHSVYYLLSAQAKAIFLREVLRVLRPGGRLILLDPADIPYPLSVIWQAPRSALSVLAWHAVNRTHSRFTPEVIARTLSGAGFARVLGERSGYGVLSRGEKPYTTASPLERTAQAAALDPITADADMNRLIALNPAQAIAHITAQHHGRAVFLLIQQTPNKPAWALQPNELITWGAASALDRESGIPVVLAFTTLPKAVEFMQSAVRQNVIVGINKVAKFDHATAARWDFPLLINPPLTALQTSARYAIPGPLIGVDPNVAITGEE